MKDQAGISVALTIEDKRQRLQPESWAFTGAIRMKLKRAKSYVGGSLIRQYMNKKDLEKAPVDVSIKTAADPDKIRDL